MAGAAGKEVSTTRRLPVGLFGAQLSLEILRRLTLCDFVAMAELTTGYVAGIIAFRIVVGESECPVP